ncbi:Hypothetical predicted protein, partial [Paramuricea clavata]
MLERRPDMKIDIFMSKIIKQITSTIKGSYMSSCPEFMFSRYFGEAINDSKLKGCPYCQVFRYYTCTRKPGHFAKQDESIERLTGLSTISQIQRTANAVLYLRGSGFTPRLVSCCHCHSFGGTFTTEQIEIRYRNPMKNLHMYSITATTTLNAISLTNMKTLPTNGSTAIHGRSRKNNGLQTPSKSDLVELQHQCAEKDRQIQDLEEKLATVKQKRLEDKVKLKELEKTKLQLGQLVTYKTKWQESQKDLQAQLKSAKKELQELKEAHDEQPDDLASLQEAVEMATLDKEMAEEKFESIVQENESLKEKVEEFSLELEILRSEVSDGGIEGAATNA